MTKKLIEYLEKRLTKEEIESLDTECKNEMRLHKCEGVIKRNPYSLIAPLTVVEIYELLGEYEHDLQRVIKEFGRIKYIMFFLEDEIKKREAEEATKDEPVTK
jgi:hypothetical protein